MLGRAAESLWALQIYSFMHAAMGCEVVSEIYCVIDDVVGFWQDAMRREQMPADGRLVAAQNELVCWSVSVYLLLCVFCVSACWLVSVCVCVSVLFSNCCECFLASSCQGVCY